MQNGSVIANERVVVRLTLVSLTRPGIVEAEAVIRSTRDIDVIEVEFHGGLSQSSTLSAPSPGAVSALGYRLSKIGAIVEVRVQRCLTDLPGSGGREPDDV